MLTELLDQYEQVEAAVTRVEHKIGEEVERAPDPFVAEAVKLLDTIPGIAERVAETIVAEVGVEMNRFATDRHLASWAGMCPGTNESAGKRKSGKTTKGNRYLRAALVQSAWAASHQKGTYLAAQYQRKVCADGQEKGVSGGGAFNLGDRVPCAQ